MKIITGIIIILIALLPIYLILINSVFNLDIGEKKVIKNISGENGENQKVNIGESIGVSIKRDRWYGVILESDNQKKLYLFNIIPIPIKKGYFNFMTINISFITIWIISLISMIIIAIVSRLE